MRQYLYQRNGIWHFRRRVPADLAHLDPRGEIRRTTKRRDVLEAESVAGQINRDLEAFWCAVSRSGTAIAPNGAAAAYERAVGLARTLGVPYRPAADLAAGDLPELVRRLELLASRNLTHSRPAVAAVLGGADKPAGYCTCQTQFGKVGDEC